MVAPQRAAIDASQQGNGWLKTESIRLSFQQRGAHEAMTGIYPNFFEKQRFRCIFATLPGKARLRRNMWIRFALRTARNGSTHPIEGVFHAAG
jgi:hypothetical protein